jgi:hypothetical protein
MMVAQSGCPSKLFLVRLHRTVGLLNRCVAGEEDLPD